MQYIDKQYVFNIIMIQLFICSKNNLGWIGGIENIYHDPCQDWLDLINMKLTSPNHPNPYKPLEECEWTINAPIGYYVTLEFEIIDVSNKRYKLLMIPIMQNLLIN